MKIADSVAFVTGANRGLGLEFARALLARGARKVYAGMRDTASFDAPDAPAIVPVRLDVNDAASAAAAAARCSDVNLLVNNAGIARLAQSVLDPAILSDAYAMFETNYFGTVRVTQAFAPVLRANLREHGGAAILNVLSVASWVSGPVLAAYSASKSAAWSFTNALRVELQDSGIQVSGMHVSYIDTDLTKGLEVPKLTPQTVVADTLDALEAGQDEILVDDMTRAVKAGLGGHEAAYLRRPAKH